MCMYHSIAGLSLSKRVLFHHFPFVSSPIFDNQIVMLYCIGIYSFFCELVGYIQRGYFPSLALEFDIT